jgi:hypothetical protein
MLYIPVKAQDDVKDLLAYKNDKIFNGGSDDG